MKEIREMERMRNWGMEVQEKRKEGGGKRGEEEQKSGLEGRRGRKRMINR